MENKSDIIFGLRPVIEAILAGKVIEKVLVQSTIKSHIFQELKDLLKENDVYFQRVPTERLNKYTNKNHQGVIAFVSPVVFEKIENVIPTIFEKGEQPFILILDRLTDVRNIGAIIRTAESVGVHAVVLPQKNSGQVNSDMVKTSTGAIFNIPICKVNSVVTVVEFLKECGLTIVSCTEKGSALYTSVNYDTPLALIMGSEENGISKSLLDLSDHKVFLPMLGKTLSLNVSVATGVLLYEVVRSRSTISE